MHIHPAVQAIASSGDYSHRHTSSTNSNMGLPSPTLTNPDMILPYNDNQRESETPSPPFEPLRTPSPSRMNPLSSSPPEFTTGTAIAVTLPYRTRKKNSPPRRYEGYEAGAPLSDIEEVESTPKSKRRSSGSLVLPTSPIAPTHLMPDRRRQSDKEKRLSGLSVDTTDMPHWEGFDSGSVAGESAIQGDDDEEEEEGILSGTELGESSQRNSLSMEDDDLGSAALSKRAERILANAKKRLTNMEDNLSKARTSLLSPSPSKSTFSLGGHQPVGGLYRSISQGGDRRLQTTQFVPPTKHRQPQSASPKSGTTLGHTRVFSETSVPASLQSSQQTPDGRIPFRSASAMGSTSTSTGFGNSVDSLLYDPSTKPLRRASTSNHHYTPLKALKEDESATASIEQAKSTSEPITHGLGITNSTTQSTAVEDFTSAHPANKLTRSSSQLQMRDLRDQMADLKSKISNLKVRAQEDNLRRRSLQSLRTPSPFTAAEMWYTSAVEYREGAPALGTNAGLGWSPKKDQGPGFDDVLPAQHASPVQQEEEQGQEEIVQSPEQERAAPVLEPDQDPRDRQLEDLSNHNIDEIEDHPHDQDAHSIIQNSVYEDASEEPSSSSNEDSDPDAPVSEADQIFLNQVLQESLQSPPDNDLETDQVFPVPIEPDVEPERHEDRADAFDYEHFFLHSALGNYSRSSLHHHRRSESMSPTESVETTRAATPPSSTVQKSPTTAVKDPTTAAQPYHASTGHLRNNSVDSVSTMATFATATEGRGSDGEDDEDEDALFWKSHAPMPASLNMNTGWAPMISTSTRSPQKEETQHSPQNLPTTSSVNGYPTPDTPSSLSNQDSPDKNNRSRTFSSSSTATEIGRPRQSQSPKYINMHIEGGKLPTPPTLSPRSPHKFQSQESRAQDPQPRESLAIETAAGGVPRKPSPSSTLLSTLSPVTPKPPPNALNSDPEKEGEGGEEPNLWENIHASLPPSDRELLERLAQSLGTVCVGLKVASSAATKGNSAGHGSHERKSSGHGRGGSGASQASQASQEREKKYEARIWRRRLDAARRVLEGEIDVDALTDPASGPVGGGEGEWGMI